MAGNATVLSTGYATVSTTGAQTGQVLNRLNSLIQTSNAISSVNAYDQDVDNGSATIAASATPGLYVVPDGSTATISIQSSAAGVVLAQNTNVTLAGGDANTGIVSQGILDYSGAAGLIDAFGDTSTVNAVADNAIIGVGGSDMMVTLGGVGQSLHVDGGTTGIFTQTGSDAAIQVGSGSASVAVASPDSGTIQLQLNGGNAVSLGSSSVSSVLVLHAGSNTISAVTGTSSVFSQGGASEYYGNAASVYFVGATSVVAVSTVFGGSGSDTVFGGTGVNYTEGSGNNVFYSGVSPTNPLRAEHSTVTATSGHDTLFGSAAGDQFNLGRGSELFVGGGGADTMFGGSAGPTVFGASGEDLKLIGTRGAFALAFGNSDTVDASLSNQGSTFFAVNYPGVGNTTLVGSAVSPSGGAHDEFVVGSVTGGGNAVHTITIDNFQSGDSFYLVGYSAADDATFQHAVAADHTKGGGLSFTLSDNTTVVFNNNHPTATFDGGTTAL